MLKTKLISIVFAVALYSFSSFGSDCSQVKGENKCNLSRSQVLTDVFEQVTLKVADFLAAENVYSLEDFSNILGNTLSEDDIEKLSFKFEKYARADQYSYFLKSLKKYNYWNKNKRLGNNQAALTILLINEKYTLGLTPEEIEVIWFMQLVNDLLVKETGKFSSAYNQFNLSNQIIKLTGAMKGSRALTESEAKSLMRKITHMNCFDSYGDFLDTELRDMFWKVIEDENLLSYDSGNILFDGVQLLNPTEITALKGSLRGVFNDDRGLLDSPLSFDKYVKKSTELNKKSNLEIIKGYHKEVLDIEYAVVDKKTKSITLYNEDGDVLDSQEINIGLSDKLNHSGAGIYEVNEADAGITLTSEKGRKLKTFETDINLAVGTKVYILPQERGNKFVIKNYKLNFVSDIKRDHYAAYNYSSRDKKEVNTTFSMNGNQSEFVEEYLETLSSEKENLMKLYNIDSETYNQLALFAFGVLAPESRFGDDIKYKLKETIPFAVSLLKGKWFNTDSNSRGPTQIKRIPKKIIKAYGIDKSDLKEAKSSAVATLGFAYELLGELKAISSKHPSINRDNIYDYLYYLYNGKRYEILRATATPDMNIAIRRIKEATKLVSIEDVL